MRGGKRTGFQEGTQQEQQKKKWAWTQLLFPNHACLGQIIMTVVPEGEPAPEALGVL